MSLSVDKRVAFEELQLGVVSLMVANLNTAIDAENAAKVALDASYASLLGRTFDGAAQHFALSSIHPGHRPSMLMAAIDEYPIISIQAYQARQAQTNQGMDHTRDQGILLSIECFVKSNAVDKDDHGSSDGEEVVERRVKRTAEAINSVMNAHPHVDHFHWPTTTLPEISFGEVFARSDLNDSNYKHYFQGVRLQYQFTKTVAWSGLTVDQLG